MFTTYYHNRNRPVAKTFIIESGSRYANSGNWTGRGSYWLREGITQTRYHRDSGTCWALVGALLLSLDVVLVQKVVSIYLTFMHG